MIQCFEEDDGSLTITWDDTDPVESVLNTWTKQDFIDAIMKRANQELGKTACQTDQDVL
jgi:hypothetical protein